MLDQHDAVTLILIVSHGYIKLATHTHTHAHTHTHTYIPVSRAVHRLEGKGLFLDLKTEHVLRVVLPVA